MAKRDANPLSFLDGTDNLASLFPAWFMHELHSIHDYGVTSYNGEKQVDAIGNEQRGFYHLRRHRIG